MALMGNSVKELDDDYVNGMTSDGANNWLNENIQLPITYILESGILRDWKRDSKETFAFHLGTR